MKKEIVLATDHAGFDLKEELKKYLIENNFSIKDFGAHENDSTDDYPDFIMPAAEYITNNDTLGIIFGGSGQGEAMAANRFKGIRATVFYGGPMEIVELSRLHNNANVLSIAARFVSLEETIKVVNLWLSIDFEGGRHLARIKKLDS